MVIKIAKTMIVNKNEAKKLITLPLLIPNYDDCDAPIGEKQLSIEEIADFSHKYMEKYRKVDGGHTYLETKKEVAIPVESWQLREDTAMKTIEDEEITYPEGTWMATLKVFDGDAWDKVNKGEYTGGSVTVLEETVADQVVSKEAAEKGRVLIKDIQDPAVATIALVEKPCVFGAKFCSVKTANKSSNSKANSFEGIEKNKVEKAGRSISESTFKKIKNAWDSLGKLIDKANNERTDAEKADKSSGKMTKEKENDFMKKKDFESFKSEFKEELIEDITKAVSKSLETEEDKRNNKISSLKSELEKIGVDTSKIDFSPKSEEKDEEETASSDKSDKEIKGSSKSLDNHEVDDPDLSTKSTSERIMESMNKTKKILNNQ